MSKHSISHSENAVGGGGAYGGGKRKTCMRHCARFWWIHLIGGIAGILLVTLLIILVAVPKIAQKKIDDAQLTVDGIIVSNTKPNSYNMAINSTLRSDGSVKATIEPFDGIMYLTDLPEKKAFVNLKFPETKSVKLQTVNISQPVEITDMAAFTTFNTWLQNNESVRVTVEGNTHVKVNGIARRYGVTFRNTMTLKGLNGYKGLNVTDNTISLTPDAQGDNFKGHVSIPNHSVLTLEIGNASFTNLLHGQDIGTVYLDNLVLYPGMNNVTMRANISQAPVLAALGTKPACDTGVIPFSLRGKDVISNGQRLPYFGDALSSGEVVTDINIGASLKKSLNITITCTGQRSKRVF
ncbi:hypothetical protein CORC01_03366 [Colletotrichum orchidophilum]|uniref:Pre-rRNA processing protein n=1 Tax=Colletotrichum orchidophilum TaxID=1209926 RepID=A0A1G4BJ63_9PEZI|nr:uncharacterized protein CORC01_03366 [Colletotrichum orchidophilum]OHF01333.1 hypothetical protein CORC01_03366 [Colletotrichum orchidophilum]